MNIQALSYNPDSCTLFAEFAYLPWAVFLDSGRPHGTQGRYDIISAMPYATLCTVGDTTTILHGDQVKTSDDDPFALLQEFLPQAIESDSTLPFHGGALGYFSYDLNRRIENIPCTTDRDIDIPEMAIGLYDWAIVVDHQLKKSYLIERDGKAKAVVGSADVTPASVGEFHPEITAEQYQQAFEKLKKYIVDGDCYQTNLTQRFSANFQGSAWEYYKTLRKKQPAAFGGYLNFPFGSILSFSPEQFLKVVDKEVETKPIKGTRPRGNNLQQDKALATELLNSEKDRSENLMIVDLMRNDLGKNCKVGSVKVPELFALESYPNVHHLVSTVTGELAEGKSSLDLLRGCFPGGSITGAPKVRAMEIIEELEPSRRSIYCGSIAYIDANGNMDSNIAIRTLLVHADKIHCWAGGAIVADSECAEEYQECFDKVGVFINRR